MKSGFSLNNQYFYLKGASKSCQIHRNFKPHLGCFNPLVASPFPPARFGLRGRELVGEIVGFEAGDPMRPRVRCGSKIVTASVGHLEHNNQPTTTTITTNQQQPTNKIESGWVLTWLWLWVMGMILVSCWRKVVDRGYLGDLSLGWSLLDHGCWLASTWQAFWWCSEQHFGDLHSTWEVMFNMNRCQPDPLACERTRVRGSDVCEEWNTFEVVCFS